MAPPLRDPAWSIKQLGPAADGTLGPLRLLLFRSPSLFRRTHIHPQSKMKSFIVFAALVAVALAAAPYHRLQAPASKSDVVILKEQPSDNIGLDSYKFAYELSDGQKRDESAQVETRANPEESVLRVRGSFSWVNPADGQTYTITYVADENGFQPQGAHLPVAPVA